MSGRRRPVLRALSLLGLLATCSGKSNARDATRVQHAVVGPSAAPAACEGLSASNANRSRTHFPQNPELSFRSRLPGGIGQAPASDAAGNLIILHGEPRLSKLDPKGRTLWSERLSSEAACAPVLTSDGSILVVTRDAEAWYFSASGKRLFKQQLELSDPRAHTLAIPTSSGGALVASGSELVQLDGSGHVLRHTRAKGGVAAIAESNGELVLVSINGAVELARESGDFELVGSFGGALSEGAAVQGGKAFAIVDAHKWAMLDLSSGQVLTLATDSTLALTGPAALFATHGAALVADGGFVSLRAPDGAEALRIALAAGAQGFDPALRGLRPALVISDPDGAVAAVQSGLDALVVSPDGSATRIDNTSCLDPFRPTPTPSGLVFACRSGQLFAVSGKAP